MIYIILLILAFLMSCASFMIVTRAGEGESLCKYGKDDI